MAPMRMYARSQALPGNAMLYARSQALPGNAMLGRLRLPSIPPAVTGAARRSLDGSAFPGGAWERAEPVITQDRLETGWKPVLLPDRRSPPEELVHERTEEQRQPDHSGNDCVLDVEEAHEIAEDRQHHRAEDHADDGPLPAT